MGPPQRKAQETAVQNTALIPHNSALPTHYASIYETNLKVIQRHVSDVVAYFDTFSHVSVFRKVTNPDMSKSWERGGEGPFFLIERSCYPPYAFYIMNRSHNGDLFHLIYPEDEIREIDTRTDFTVYQAFPEYTEQRLAKLPQDLDRFSPQYFVDPLPAREKGEPMMFGLWWKPTGIRDSIDVVLKRVIRCTREGKPYPLEYRCTPEKPPELRDILDHGSASNVMGKLIPETQPNESWKKSAVRKGPKSARNQEPSLPVVEEATSTPLNKLSANNTTNAVDALFAGLKPQTPPIPAASPSQSSSAATVTGIPLLDSIFASAAAEASPTPTPQPPHASVSDSFSSSSDDSPNPIPLTVYNLTPDVLQGLISGTIPLQSEAVRDPDSSSASSASSRSRPRTGGTGRSREADDESSATSFHESGSISETSTVLDSAPSSDLDEPPAIQATPRVNGESRALPPSSDVLSTSSHRERSLVPFSDESELWPYAPSSNKEDNIPEFDFSDTRHLDSLTSGYAPSMAPMTVLVNGSVRPVNGTSSSHSRGNSGMDTSNSENLTKGTRKNCRDRKERQRKEREEIEKSWDFPTPVNPVTAAPTGLLTTGSQFQQFVPQSESSAVTPRADPAPLDPAQARQAILDALKGRLVNGSASVGAGSPRLPKNDFVREILTLIHTDRSFVDSIWNGYYTSS